jgi:hypothetical protein
MKFTKEQLSDILIKHLDKENGLQDLMQLMIEKENCGLMILQKNSCTTVEMVTSLSITNPFLF